MWRSVLELCWSLVHSSSLGVQSCIKLRHWRVFHNWKTCAATTQNGMPLQRNTKSRYKAKSYAVKTDHMCRYNGKWHAVTTQHDVLLQRNTMCRYNRTRCAAKTENDMPLERTTCAATTENGMPLQRNTWLLQRNTICRYNGSRVPLQYKACNAVRHELCRTS
jgi:hypothetical protein